MASISKAAILLSLNLLFFTVVSSTHVSFPLAPKKGHKHTPSTKPRTCSKVAIKLGVCADLLGLGLINVNIGEPSKIPCCSFLQGLVDLEAAVCLCTALKANVLGIDLNLPINLSLILNLCGKDVPKGFQC